jgi:hypothetical protein
MHFLEVVEGYGMTDQKRNERSRAELEITHIIIIKVNKL